MIGFTLHPMVAPLALILSFLSVINGARILMSSPQIESHIREQLAFGEELKKHGHEIYVALGTPYPKMESIKERGFGILTYNIPMDVMYMASDEAEIYLGNKIFNESRTMIQEASFISSIVNRDCTYMMVDETFMAQVRKMEFDLLLVEPFILGLCNTILPHHLRLPFISMTNGYAPIDIRSPALPSFYPRFFFPVDNQEQISFTARLVNFLGALVFELNFPLSINTNTSLLEKFAPGVSDWKELTLESELFFYEKDHHIESPLPDFPNMISIAGLTCKPAKNLPTDLENIARNNKHGVILLSFGSMANYFPKDILMKFLNVFSRLNETVIAKFIVPDDVIIPRNVKILKWLPQNDLLGHPKTKLFITHCGNNGQHEALYHGVPMIGFPLFAEQHMNCHRGFMKGFGLKMDIHSFTEDELFENIQEVLNNPKYSATIKRASEIFRSQPMTPQQRVVYWTEHVIKYGGKHLRSSAMDLPRYQFLMLDVVGFMLAILTVLCFSIFCVCRFIFRKCWAAVGSNKSKAKKSKSKIN